MLVYNHCKIQDLSHLFNLPGSCKCFDINCRIDQVMITLVRLFYTFLSSYFPIHLYYLRTYSLNKFTRLVSFTLTPPDFSICGSHAALRIRNNYSRHKVPTLAGIDRQNFRRCRVYIGLAMLSLTIFAGGKYTKDNLEYTVKPR